MNDLVIKETPDFDIYFKVTLMLMVVLVASVSLCSLCVEVGVSPPPQAWCPATPGARSPSSVCPTVSSAGYSGGLAVVTSPTSAGGEVSVGLQENLHL